MLVHTQAVPPPEGPSADMHQGPEKYSCLLVHASLYSDSPTEMLCDVEMDLSTKMFTAALFIHWKKMRLELKSPRVEDWLRKCHYVR